MKNCNDIAQVANENHNDIAQVANEILQWYCPGG